MKTLRKRLMASALAAVLALGLAVPALAYSTPDFSDLPADNWAYGPVMRMADQGIIQGTGGGMFSPTMKVSAAQFLTLVGRIVFPETKVNEGDTWYGPYMAAAQSNGLLAGAQVDANAPESEITRYDMAVVLRAAAKELGKAETMAQASQVTDYGDIPTRYADAVLAVYGMGLITGDQNGSFNGANTMMRNELATVIDRLVALKAPGSTTAEPEKPTESPVPSTEPLQPPIASQEPQIVTAEIGGRLRYYPIQGQAGWGSDGSKIAPAGIPYKLLYTEDGGVTSQVICEGKTSEPISDFDAEFPIDKALLDNPNGQFFISAEAKIDGQKFVTQDRRTDGRQSISTVEVYEKGHSYSGLTPPSVVLVPPTGQRWDFELTGHVPNSADAADYYSGNGPYEYHSIVDSYTAFIIQLVYYPSPELQDRVPTGTRIVLGETTGNEDGTFLLPISIDTLDLVSGENFRIEVFGTYHGQYHYSPARTPLKTLSDIKINSNAAWGTTLLFDRP